MIRVSVKEQIQNLIILLMLQLPLIHRITLFDKAFGFFYVGFLLLLPTTLSRSRLMLIAFGAGLLVDVFSDTPGIHAGASVFIMFIRDFWLHIVNDDSKELINVNMTSLKKGGFVYFLYPLVFIHHFLIFSLENGGLHHFGALLEKVIFSSIFSFIIIFAINFVISPNDRRS